jgi:hypothetical protein
MAKASNWQDVKSKAREIDPAWESEARTTRRAMHRERMVAAVSGAQLADIRKELGISQQDPGR